MPRYQKFDECIFKRSPFLSYTRVTFGVDNYKGSHPWPLELLERKLLDITSSPKISSFICTVTKQQGPTLDIYYVMQLIC